MTDKESAPDIHSNDSTKALLGLALALIYEIKHHRGYDGERFADALKAIAAELKPETPGLAHLMKTFDTMITKNVTFEKKNGSADKS